jgi:hypothetical protein
MGLVTRKNLFAIMGLCAMVALLLLPIVMALPSPAIGEEAPAANAEKKEGDKVEKGRDVYYKTEGIVMGAPAPKTVDGPRDYPRYNFESRVLLWFANQQHLYYGSFVLAVPIFCMIIEFMGVVTKDKALAKRYDQLAFDRRFGRHFDLYLLDALSGILRVSIRHLPPGHAYLCADVCGGEWNPLHLLLWLGQDEGRVLEVDSPEHVGGPQYHRDLTHVPGEFMDRFHDVTGGCR